MKSATASISKCLLDAALATARCKWKDGKRFCVFQLGQYGKCEFH